MIGVGVVAVALVTLWGSPTGFLAVTLCPRVLASRTACCIAVVVLRFSAELSQLVVLPVP